MPGVFHQGKNQQLLNTKDKLKILQKGDLGLNCLYSNVDQLLNKIDDLHMLIASEKLDIIVFTEVIPKALPILETQMKITGYDMYKKFNNTDTNLGASGIRSVAIYVKDNMNCKEIKMKNMFGDHVSVEINLRKDDRLHCGCIYRSQTNEKAETIENTTKVCQLIVEAEQRNNSHLLICGDFNYPSIDWENKYVNENSSIITPFIETNQKCKLHQHIPAYKIQRRR